MKGLQHSGRHSRCTFYGCIILLSTHLAGIASAAVSIEEKRDSMVRWDIAARGISNETVLQAMRTVPREKFVPKFHQRRAYSDQPLPIGYGQTISQPYIVAYMTEVLQPQPEHRALEIGTGSGYQAAILAEIVKEVYTIEIIQALGMEASARLEKLGYQNIKTYIGDGYYGWEKHAPFDLIIVTAAASHIPPPLIEQLKPGGRMVIPVGPVMQPQHLLLIKKDAEGSVTIRSLLPVRFVPLTGHH